MFEKKYHSLVIVYDNETKQCAEFLSRLLHELYSDAHPIKAIMHDAKKFAALPSENKTSQQRILYIGEFKESKIVAKNIEWIYDEHGIQYGWHGNKAVIFFSKKRISETEFYEMAEYAKKCFDGYSFDMLAHVDESNYWNEMPTPGKIAIVAGGVLSFLLGMGAVTNKLTDENDGATDEPMGESSKEKGMVHNDI